MSESQYRQHSIRYGSHLIRFYLQFRRRRTLEISVYPDLSVRVIAPMGRSMEAVKEKVRGRAAWILKQKGFFSLYLPKQPERKYFSGESHYYLGRQYRLKILGSTNCHQVKLTRGCLYVWVRNRKDRRQVKKLLDAWYKRHAKEVFQKRLASCLEAMGKHRLDLPDLQIRRMSTRWGSCPSEGKMILNTHLIKAPSHCIEYVITHELCHLKHPNHSKSFYKLLSQVMPDWDKRKRRLNEVQI